MSAICGIVGESAAGGRGRRDVSLMLDLLPPRGPDGAILHEQRRRPAAGVRRAAARRRWAPADQPVLGRGADPATFAVCDGEIFNAEECAPHLRGAGRTLRGDDDAELFAHLYELEGPRGFRRVDAQFAVALWDGRRNRAGAGARSAGRARAVYYRATPGGVLFASEIKALLAVPDVPVRGRRDRRVALPHVPDRARPAHAVQGDQQAGGGIDRDLRPADGSADVQPFWDLLWDPIPEVDDESFYVDRVRELHDAAVARRMVRRDRSAALVSGGNDSSANASIMARKIREAGGDRKPCTRSPSASRSSRATPSTTTCMYAKQVADLIGSTAPRAPDDRPMSSSRPSR